MGIKKLDSRFSDKKRTNCVRITQSNWLILMPNKHSFQIKKTSVIYDFWYFFNFKKGKTISNKCHAVYDVTMASGQIKKGPEIEVFELLNPSSLCY
jgi:hypothetical protein